MKEILYIQAGELSNYTGTHFWNTQESYLQFDESQDSEIASGISFCETVDAQERATLCPRLLVFDRKSNFGTLGTSNALGSLGEDNDGSMQAVWSGQSVEYRQELITKSTYQTQLEAIETAGHEKYSTSAVNQNQDVGDIRYWSDFSRVYYLPRSLQQLPDLPDWETTSLDWNQGQELFTRFNEESELMDGALRLFVEECDHMQGIQIMSDTDTFGSFISSFLAPFRDEYQKLPSFAFPVLSGVTSSTFDHNETSHARQLVNEALHLRTLNEFSSMNIPIEKPRHWPSTVWGGPLNIPSGGVYHQSAILSAHVETCTLPFRLKRSQQDISSLCGQLNWRSTSPFGELGGVFPFTASADFEARLINFSSDLPIKLSNQYAQFDVTRGFSSKQIEEYDKWSSRYQHSNVSYCANIHASPYPLPNSFPLFKASSAEYLSQTTQSNAQEHSTLPVTQVYSSLSTSGNTSKVLEKYALFIENCIKRRTTYIASLDMSLDDLKELLNDLWTMHDNSSEENGEFSP